MPQPLKILPQAEGFTEPNSPLPEGCPRGGVLKNGQNFVSGSKLDFHTINETIIYHKPLTDLPYNPKLKERAKLLRRAGNLPEVLFWMQVTKGNFHHIDFDRQRIIGNYIVDFYIKSLGLIIEIDRSVMTTKETTCHNH